MASLAEAKTVAEHFRIERPFQVGLYENNGNINDTFLVTCGDGHHYLLQHVNTSVFPMPERVMAGGGLHQSAHDALSLLNVRNGKRWNGGTASGGDAWDRARAMWDAALHRWGRLLQR